MVYRLIDPEQYEGKRVLVVGGGDSALEAAASIAEVEGAKVALSYRGETFVRAKAKNRQLVETARQEGRLLVATGSTVKQITPDAVMIEHKRNVMRLSNDAVIVAAGGLVPTDFLKGLGIRIETKYGTA